VITTLTVLDGDSTPDYKRVVYTIEPSPDASYFILEPRGLYCDVVLVDKLEADIPTNATVATVVYSINVRA